jgi:rare lipoprotein A
MNLKLGLLLVAGLANVSGTLEQSYNKVGYVQEGVASYYADQFHGRKTANGERFDMHALTCAHPRIRFNTELKVTNLVNGRSVVVRVNDRGPYVDNRVIDLSLAAAKKLDMIRSGTSRVRCEVIAVEDMPPSARERMERERREREEQDRRAEEEKANPQKKPSLLEKLGGVFNKKKKEEPVAKEPEVDKPRRQPVDPKTKEPVDTKKPPVDPKPKEKPKEPVLEQPKETEAEPRPSPGGGQVDMPQRARRRPPLTEDTFAGINTYSIWGTIKYPEGFGVQVASYAVLDKALEKGREINEEGLGEVFVQTGWAGDKRIYRLVVGEGPTAGASELAGRLRAKGYGGFVKQHY